MANEYVTVPELKTQLGITDAAYDVTLTRVASAASRAVDRWCNRRFFTTAADEARYFTASSANETHLGDTVSITSVASDPAADGTFTTAWASTAWRLAPYNASLDGEPFYVLEAATRSPLFPLHGRGVRVTGKFGWASVPDDAKEAVIMLALRYFRRKDAPFGVAGSGEMGFIRVRPDSDVAELLHPLRLTTAA